MRHLLLSAAFALLSVSASTAFAFDGHGHGHGYGHHHERHWDDDDRGYYRDRPERWERWENREYRRGERVEVVYLQPRYYVDDYEYYDLREPPRGHRWVRTEDGRFILVAVATGIIADILLHH